MLNRNVLCLYVRSGVEINDECKTEFQLMKHDHKYRYIIFNLTDDFKQMVIEKTAEPSSTYDDFVADLKQAEEKCECRHAVFDAEYSTKDGEMKNKIVLFQWSPEQAKIKQKMVYASCIDALKKALGVGIAREIQANDHNDLSWNNVLRLITK